MSRRDPIRYMTGNKLLVYLSYGFLILGILGMILLYIYIPSEDEEEDSAIKDKIVETGWIKAENVKIVFGTSSLIFGIVLYLLLQKIVQLRVKKLVQTLNH
ncbi:MAG: hypothetical protein K8S56_02710 [Candidatus Cloacimonetes bacterium]|nr:hypothetical protein [Candidatus Cloacimonadota bacterium]